jgi:CoA-transferase family III
MRTSLRGPSHPSRRTPLKYPCPLSSACGTPRPLGGIKVLELCRIIAGPTIGRILGEYGADVLKVTGPGLSNVPFFQVDGNMGKHATEIDLKSPKGRYAFEQLLEEADVILDGYRPGALDKLGYSPVSIARLAKKRGKGLVYVNENCFGYTGEWADRPGWQQIADCVCDNTRLSNPTSSYADNTQVRGVAWSQGEFMNLNEPVVPPFPISDYGTDCIGAIAALTGLYHHATRGGSWHGKVSLLLYDLLLFKVEQYPEAIKQQLRAQCSKKFLARRHNHSVDDISGTALSMIGKNYPELFEAKNTETWYSKGYDADIRVVRPVLRISGLEIGFRRGSRPNGYDEPSWDFSDDGDFLKRSRIKI